MLDPQLFLFAVRGPEPQGDSHQLDEASEVLSHQLKITFFCEDRILVELVQRLEAA